MDERTYKLIGASYLGNQAEDVKNPGLWLMIGFLFVVSFLGLFTLVPLRNVMVMDYKLTYPSGATTTMLINSFHTKAGVELAGKQVKCLGKYLSLSLFWSCFKGFYNDFGMLLIRNSKSKQNLLVMQEFLGSEESKILDEQKKRDEIFLKDMIPSSFVASGYVALAAVSTATIPLLLPPLKWYLVLCAYLVAPVLAFCNSYETGLID
ncbi:hypothetical protein Droror1_Dr00019921 [Drosera rotundifolia]